MIPEIVQDVWGRMYASGTPQRRVGDGWHQPAIVPLSNGRRIVVVCVSEHGRDRFFDAMLMPRNNDGENGRYEMPASKDKAIARMRCLSLDEVNRKAIPELLRHAWD